MSLTVSVITPSFNQGEFIERTIRSVLDQAPVDLEYVVVDGGSSDSTLAVLKRHENRLRWSSEPDRGQAHAVNKGIAATGGEIIGWRNSDDVYVPGAIAVVLDVFAAEGDVDVVYGLADHIDADDAVIDPYPTQPWDMAALRRNCYLCQPAVFFRRRVVERFGPLDESLHYGLDYEYWLRLAMGGAKFRYLQTPLAGSRVHERTKTLARRSEAYFETCRMLKKRLGVVPGNWMFGYGAARAEKLGLKRSQKIRFAMVAAPVAAWACLRLNWRLTGEWFRALGRLIRSGGD